MSGSRIQEKTLALLEQITLNAKTIEHGPGVSATLELISKTITEASKLNPFSILRHREKN